MTPLGRYALETVVTLLAIVGLAFGVLALARRGGMGRPTGPLSLIGRLTLEPRRSVYLVRVGELVYVIGASEAGLAKLGELSADAVPSPLISDEPRVSAQFISFLQNRTRARAPSDVPRTPKDPA